MRQRLIDLVLFHQGNYRKVLKAFRKREWAPPQKTNFKTVVIHDDAYPACFYRLQYPPLVLFYEGNLNLLNLPTLSVVGSRVLDDYSIRVTQDYVKLVSHNFVIVSGCAKGIDTIAHTEAIQNKGKTVAFLGCGLDIAYPRCNVSLIQEIKENHLCISEFPENCPPLKHHFPWRNRLIAASSQSLWVMSAMLKSGTMHTVEMAMELNNQIYGCPHPIDSQLGEGIAKCINDGALYLTKELVLDMIKNSKGVMNEKFSDCGISIQIEND